ncbi:MAG TPA: hypothetical protein VHB77_02845 [Planctomycetaceae bacterium]|nr:hypothetical protein [Planctomycetaceae bacterium]
MRINFRSMRWCGLSTPAVLGSLAVLAVGCETRPGTVVSVPAAAAVRLATTEEPAKPAPAEAPEKPPVKVEDQVAAVDSNAAPAAGDNVTAMAQSSSVPFPNDLGGKELRNRLSPPRMMPLDPVPYVAEPEPRVSRLDGTPFKLSPLAGVPARREAYGPAALDDRIKLLAVVDQPPLFADLQPQTPSPLRILPSPPAHVYSRGSETYQPLSGLSAPPPEPPQLTDDPTREGALITILATKPQAGTTAAAFQPIGIPDPEEIRRGLPPATALADADPPTPLFTRPSQATVTLPPAPMAAAAAK